MSADDNRVDPWTCPSCGRRNGHADDAAEGIRSADVCPPCGYRRRPSRIRYGLIDGVGVQDLDYATEPTHVRVYREDCGDDWPWHVDAVDEEGNYSEAVNRYATHAEAITVGVLDLFADMASQVKITRDNQQTDVIYVGKWAVSALPFRGFTVFVSPDGVGRYYYDGINAARREHGDLPVRFVAQVED